MYDAMLLFKGVAERKSQILNELTPDKQTYILAIIHRNYNTDYSERLSFIV
jgi:UDP-GlcNAc3NAcA epimerase